MKIIDKGNYFEWDKKTGKRTMLATEDATRKITEEIIQNYDHLIGPNSVVNNEEVLRLIPLLYDNVEALPEYLLCNFLSDIMLCLAKYKENRDLVCTFYLAKLLFKIARVLIFDYYSGECIFLMTIFSKERLFPIYLIDRNNYKHIVAAFYSEMNMEPYAYGYGFYDVRHIYDSKNAFGDGNEVDVDHIVIAEIYACFAIQMNEDGTDCEYIVRYLDQYKAICDFSMRFWEIIHDSCTKKLYPSSSGLLKLYKECMQGDSDTPYFREVWFGLAFVIADVKSKFKLQKRVAKEIGYPIWDGIIDRRKLLTSSKTLLIIIGIIILTLVISLIYYRAYILAVVFVLAFSFAETWAFYMDDAQRSQAYWRAIEENKKVQYETGIRNDLANIAQAAQMGTWYEPVHLKQWGTYYYHNFFV